jgi:NADPH-dependent 2,4-dienoyl-CoA reductase/sulfur reductase-like enzyme
VVDIFQIRHGNVNGNHPTGFNSVEHEYETLAPAAAMKQAGINILTEVIGGYQDPGDAERILEEGKADLIGAARAFFCDMDFYEKLLDGRGEDIVPCVRCNKCHVPSLKGHWNSSCSINPTLGIHHVLNHLTKPASGRKNVAIIGGGPAGMRCALFCKERGYKVTLYEKTGKLGGQLYHADYPSFKWPVRRYRDYLIQQLDKQGIEVHLNTEATPERIADGCYDAVVVAIGALPKHPNIKGADELRWNTLNLFGREAELGKNVVVIGGSESGVETALYLCETGHDVTILTRRHSLAHDATPIHYRETIVEKWASYPDRFHSILDANTVEVSQHHVVYVDTTGIRHTVCCDDVIALGGMQPLHKQAAQFYGTARQVLMIGDCYEVGNIRTCNRMAFAAANQI